MAKARFCLDDYMSSPVPAQLSAPRRHVLLLDYRPRPRENRGNGAAALVAPFLASLGPAAAAASQSGPWNVNPHLAYWDASEGRPVAWRYPRNVPWTELPALAAPAWSLEEGIQGWYGGECTVLDRTAWSALSDVVHVVILPGFSRETALLDLGRMSSLTGRDFEMHVLSDGEFCDLPASDVAACMLARRAEERLSWNWRWNAEILLPRLIAEAYRTRRPPGGNMDGSDTWEIRALQALAGNPFALQVLYWVARKDPRPLPSAGDRYTGYPGILAGAGTSRVSGGGVTSLDWNSHPGAQASYRRHGMQTRFGYMLAGAADMLCRAGLLVPDASRHARLGRPGAALLGMLPAGCRDLGMPTRWITPEGGIGQDGDIPSIDRWLTAVLRQVKRAANGIRTDMAGDKAMGEAGGEVGGEVGGSDAAR